MTEPIALEAGPEASVERVQVEKPQASKRVWPVVTEKVAVVLGMGVVPSCWRTLTVKGVDVEVVAKSWPEGAEMRVRVSCGAA